MNLDDALPGFVAEAGDLLRDMESGLLKCTGAEPDAETINLIFRAAHTIKGSAGLFGLDPIVSFVHVVESVLDRVRLKDIPMSEELVALMLTCKDHVQSLVGQVLGAPAGDSSLAARSEELLQALRATTADSAQPVSVAGGRDSPAAAPSKDEPAPGTRWHVSIRFTPGVLSAGMDPVAFIRYLKTFCVLQSLRVIEDGFPATAEFRPEDCYIGFEIDLSTSSGREAIQGAFEFVRDDCTLEITESGHEPEVAKSSNRAVPPMRARVPAAAESNTLARSVRVDAVKLDTLITRIGELIIASAGVNMQARQTGSSELEERTSTLTALVEQVRDGVLQLRMVRIGGTFDRFKRVVHDVSREIGKDIELVLRGEDTELDKTVVEQIGDPLTHLVRNAIDHGIEPADIRTARGKNAAGTITLNAFHDSGSIVIEVSDDGGGLKRDRILAKARERGLVAQDAQLSEAEIFNLIFEPGFSTAQAVTNLSGRGVGMDVVKRNITALRGTVSIRSIEDQGTTVTVRLPLTLAIINGFQVAVGNSNYVLPLDAIEECIEYRADDRHDFTNLRGQVLPFVRLRELVGTREPPPARRPSIVVVKSGGMRAGIVVDALLGEFQTVIKPLGKLFRRVDYISGSSILGNGEVALILDVPALIKQAMAGTAAGAAA